MKHYIAMAGMHGCLPNTCDVYDTLSDAVASLAEMHDEPRGMKTRLRRDRYCELSLKRDGNEYAEISECNCAEPWIHSDSTTEKEWKQDHPEGDTE